MLDISFYPFLVCHSLSLSWFILRKTQLRKMKQQTRDEKYMIMSKEKPTCLYNLAAIFELMADIYLTYLNHESRRIYSNAVL